MVGRSKPGAPKKVRRVPDSDVPADVQIVDAAIEAMFENGYHGTSVREIADRPDVIFHLAAIVSGEAEANFGLGYRVNLDGTFLGCRYAIGAIPFEKRDWRRHFGRAWSMVARAKAHYDPKHILTPGQRIFR